MQTRLKWRVARCAWLAAIVLLAAAGGRAQDRACIAGRIGYQYKSDRIQFDLPSDWQVTKTQTRWEYCRTSW